MISAKYLLPGYGINYLEAMVAYMRKIKDRLAFNQWTCPCGNTTSLIDERGAYCKKCERLR
jgi:hypothetical protein